MVERGFATETVWLNISPCESVAEVSNDVEVYI